MNTHDSRAGPGAQKGEQGPPSKAALPPPDQPPRRDSAFLYATASGDGSPSISPASLTDIPGTPYDGGTDTGWCDVDGIRGRVVILRVPDGGRLSRFIQNLLLDADSGGPPPDDHDALSGVREPLPVPPFAGGSAVAAAAAVPERELVLV